MSARSTSGSCISRTILGPIATAELWRLSEDELETALATMLATEAAAAAGRAALLVAAGEHGLRARTGAPTTARWLTQRLRLSRGRAERVLREAEVVSAEPAVLEALASGRCSAEQAVVIG